MPRLPTVGGTRVDGEVIATDWDELTDGTPAVPITITQFGVPLDPAGLTDTWSHTAIDGPRWRLPSTARTGPPMRTATRGIRAVPMSPMPRGRILALVSTIERCGGSSASSRTELTQRGTAAGKGGPDWAPAHSVSACRISRGVLERRRDAIASA